MDECPYCQYLRQNQPGSWPVSSVLHHRVTYVVPDALSRYLPGRSWTVLSPSRCLKNILSPPCTLFRACTGTICRGLRTEAVSPAPALHAPLCASKCMHVPYINIPVLTGTVPRVSCENRVYRLSRFCRHTRGTMGVSCFQGPCQDFFHLSRPGPGPTRDSEGRESAWQHHLILISPISAAIINQMTSVAKKHSARYF